ncbi:MAG TPA: response regulator [Kaistella sp.]|nr:response regulator [Kaistella sp.]
MKTIFILEDEDSIRDVLNVLFSIEGYNVLEASNITDFSKLHGESEVNLYILDVRLPDGSGIDVCNGLKNSSSETPILMMSAHAKTIEIDKRCNPNAFISKPFDIDDLLASVRNLIGPA